MIALGVRGHAPFQLPRKGLHFLREVSEKA